MATTTNLSLTLPDPGEESSRGTWGATLNTAISGIDTAIGSRSVPSGGSDGQVLTKDGSSDYSTEWSDSTASGTVTSHTISGSDGIEIDSGATVTTSGTTALGINKASLLSHLNVEDGADVTDATNVNAAGALMHTDVPDSDTGFVKRTGSETYDVVADSSTNWDSAYTHSQAAHAPSNAEQNVQSDWDSSSGDSQILNKPTIPSGNQILDWAADQGSTNIHSGNYTNTTYSNSDFDHDQLTNFVANEHIDWTTDQGSTNIHANNVASSGGVTEDEVVALALALG